MGTDTDHKKFQELEAMIDGLALAGKDTEGRRAVLIQVLHKAQELFGYLPEEVQKFVAGKLALHLSEVYGVVSFYHLFKTKRSGKYCIEFCMGTACYVRGATKLIEQAEQALGVKLGETTPDGRFTLGQLRCVGACSLAPVIQIAGKTFGRVTAEQLPGILAEFK
ncbi:MAG: NAD(P)H-dependent oxidoreductase subunit E [Lentisphaeria bacterium]|jgi:NADH:ubiquinone oxidoreductase subunit E